MTQRPSQPFRGPQPPTDEGPASLVDSGPLYAGMSVARVTDIRPAAELVQELTPVTRRENGRSSRADTKPRGIDRHSRPR